MMVCNTRMRERATTAFCVRKFVCFHRMPSSCSWQQTTLGSLIGEPWESLCHASKYFMVPVGVDILSATLL